MYPSNLIAGGMNYINIYKYLSTNVNGSFALFFNSNEIMVSDRPNRAQNHIEGPKTIASDTLKMRFLPL